MTTPITRAATRQYLVISAGIKAADGAWEEGGELFSFALSEVEGMTADALLAMLGVKNDTIELCGKFTIPAERINFLGFIIKWKAQVENLTVEATIVNETGLAALKAGQVSVCIGG